MAEIRFERLDPPPGGLTGLRRRIVEERRWRTRLRFVRRSAVAVLLIGLTSWAAVEFRAQDIATPELDHVRIHLGLLPVPAEVVTIPDAQRGTFAVQRVQLPTERVVFYRLLSLEEASMRADARGQGVDSTGP